MRFSNMTTQIRSNHHPRRGLPRKKIIFGFTLPASISLSLSLAISAVPHVVEAHKQLQIIRPTALPSFSLSCSFRLTTNLSLTGEILSWMPAALPCTKSQYFEVVVRCPWPLLIADTSLASERHTPKRM